MEELPSGGRRRGRPPRRARRTEDRRRRLLSARKAPRRTGIGLGSLTVIALMVLVVLLGTPTTGSFSLYEDPRGEGVAWLPATSGEPGDPQLPGDQAPGEGNAAPGQTAEPPARSGPEGGPITYVVRPGDTLSDISSRYGVTVTDLWIANRLVSPHVLRAGQSLVIPSSRGDLMYGETPAAGAPAGEPAAPAQPVYHRVKTGENLWVIARQYGTTIEAICQLNELSEEAVLPAGSKIEVPQGATNLKAGNAGFSVALPVNGEITSGFGMRHGRMHEGIDIAAPRGTPLLAAAAGQVRSAGRMGNYGLAVIIDHGGGYATLYAHCDRLLVSKGQKVAAGQKIALLGNTGRSTGPHVHFEVIVQGRRRNPLEYLF